jgi:2,4-dienoyl-CoA reductase-like NADH-dependent reductase (Old Yellow Enzyme family)
MAKLDSSFTLQNGVALKNRLVKSAMSEQLGDKHHNPVPGLADLYGRWAQGGIGLSMTGNIMVDRNALGEPGNVVLDEKSNLSLFKTWAKAGTQHNTHLWPQLNHPGKQVPDFLSKQPVAPSAIPLQDGLAANFKLPKALSELEIREIIQKFSTSARLSKEAGFSGVQIHGAHGYLVNQFLSSRHNQREDQWGGTLENRMRFVLEIYRAIRKQVGADFPVGIKLNSADFMKGGFTEQESMQVVQALANEGIDQIEISGGSYEKVVFIEGNNTPNKPVKDSTEKREAYFLDYATKVRKLTHVPLVVTGGFRSAHAMEDALLEDATDFIGVGRSLTLDPDFPNKVMKDQGHSIQLPSRTTGIKKLDQMMMMDVLWYQQQMVRMSNKLEPNPKMSEWGAILKSIAGIGRYAFRRVRA